MNYLDADPDSPIYRITGANYVLQNIKEGRLTMTRINRSEWGDPTENPLLVAPFRTSDGNDLTLSSLTGNFFGSCWSLRQLGTEKDWEAFNHGEPSVRIESTPRKLLNGFQSIANDPYNVLKLWIGTVAYDDLENIRVFFDDPDWEKHLDSSNATLVKTVLRLRSNWKNEQEVRLIFDRFGDDWDNQNAELRPLEVNAPRIAIRFNWSNVVTSLYAGPKLPASTLADLKKSLRQAERSPSL